MSKYKSRLLLNSTVQALAEVPSDTPVLLAFSGGADSSALLHCLWEQSRANGFPLLLAHVDHGIRGAEARRDCEFCRAQANAYGVELCVAEVSVPTLAREHGRGLEEEARAVRYDFFARLMEQRKIPLLVTAHHADDNLETVLFHLSRGTGLGGLSGIAPVRPFANGSLVRPLLHVSHRELLQYCAEHRIPYVTDSTNADVTYARNRIRAEVVPVLEELCPGVQHRTARLCEQLREDDRLLFSMAEDLLRRDTVGDRIAISALQAAPLPIRTRALLLWGREQCGVTPEAVHLDALLRLCAAPLSQTEVALPHDKTICSDGRYLFARTRDRRTFGDGGPLPTSEICESGVTNIRVLTEKIRDEIKVNNLSTAPYIILSKDFDIIKSGAYWRTRKPGETFLFGGMHRKLRKLQAEAHIPVRRRERLPLLCDADGILWAPFVGLRDGINGTTDPDAAEDDAILIELVLPDRDV